MPYRLSKRYLHLALLTSIIGNFRLPSLSIARRRMIPVVVSSHPPYTYSRYCGYSLCIRFTRSPPSSMIMFGRASMTRRVCRSYSSGVLLYHANTSSPSCTRAAATSSCVDSGLLPVTYISAPPAASTRHRYAVFASKCIERATRSPSNGRVFSNSSRMLRSKGIFAHTQSIFILPLFQSDGSLISDISVNPRSFQKFFLHRHIFFLHQALKAHPCA